MFFETVKNIGRFLTGKSYSVGIIGGADGPTAVYLSPKAKKKPIRKKKPIMIAVITAAVCLAVVICRMIKRK